jgi:hypothetical protein
MLICKKCKAENPGHWICQHAVESEDMGGLVAQALKQLIVEATLREREACAKIAESFEPDEKLDGVSYASREIRSR